MIVVAMGLVLGLLAAVAAVVARTALRMTPPLADALRPFVGDLEKIRRAISRRPSTTTP
jgi:hypothetical protein